MYHTEEGGLHQTSHRFHTKLNVAKYLVFTLSMYDHAGTSIKLGKSSNFLITTYKFGKIQKKNIPCRGKESQEFLQWLQQQISGTSKQRTEITKQRKFF